MMNHTAIIIVTFNPSSEDLQHIRNLSASCEGYIVDNSPSPILQQKEIGKMKECCRKIPIWEYSVLPF